MTVVDTLSVTFGATTEIVVVEILLLLVERGTFDAFPVIKVTILVTLFVSVEETKELLTFSVDVFVVLSMSWVDDIALAGVVVLLGNAAAVLDSVLVLS